jgi:hypothetical protein
MNHSDALKILHYDRCEHRAVAVRHSASRRGNIRAAIRAAELETAYHWRALGAGDVTTYRDK